MPSDADYMSVALEEARMAAAENEVPVGAALIYKDQVLARDHNRMVQLKNPLAHAELLVLQTATSQHPDPWLLDSTLYVTLEPCVMCAGAMVLARISRLVFATHDPKAGACGSTMNVLAEPHLNHHPLVESGILQAESSELLKSFFRTLRK
ncbi:MAG TPA: tRNA adenosine(34) deaminase TadA [Acidobacteriota bacterium]|nr:tRNA adenosine(34) deaminase TadA [Acidobacteriota bacterium]